jgi:hypothetical protein
VAISRDGGTFLCGSPSDTSSTGKVVLTGVATTTAANGNFTFSTVLSNLGTGLSTGDMFGKAMDLSQDGQVIAVGAPGRTSAKGEACCNETGV